MSRQEKRRIVAFVLMGGTACTLNALSRLLYLVSPQGWPLIPGFSALATLYWPLLFLSGGLLVRGWLRNPRGWVKALVLCMAVCGIVLSVTVWDSWPSRAAGWSIAALGAGYLFPRRLLKEAGKQRGWAYLLMLAVSAAGYVAVSVVKQRLQFRGPLMPDHPDMEGLLRRLMTVSVPLLLTLVLYFAAMFAFSRTGQRIGIQRWFPWLMLAPCVVTFVAAAGSLSGCPGPRWFWPLVLLVQPVAVYLVMLACRYYKGSLWQGRYARIRDIYPSSEKTQ